MKILFVGLGSIGQRHLRNIRNIYGKSVEIIAYRSKGLSQTLNNNLEVVDGVNLEDYYGIKSFYDLNQALAENPDIAFITNVTSQHVSYAIKCAEAGCDLFIEKPLSDTLEDLDKLESIVKLNKIKVFLGFQNRYHPCLLKVKELLESNKMGKIISAEAETGELLSNIHKYEDFRKTYMANKNLGGGVVLSQLIHEIDYLAWLIGNETVVVCASLCSADYFNFDVEDNCTALLKINDVPTILRANFIQKQPSRYCRFNCENGYIIADIINNKITWTYGNIKTTHSYDDFHRNDMFMNELNDFFKCILTGCNTSINLTDGINSLKTALLIKNEMRDKNA